VRGWLRRLRARAARLLQEVTAGFGFLVTIAIEAVFFLPVYGEVPAWA